MMARTATVARVATRVARPTVGVARTRCMSTAPKNADPLLGEGFVVRFENKPAQVFTGHAVWDPNNKSNGYIFAIGGVVAAGCFFAWLPWRVQGTKWRAANGL